MMSKNVVGLIAIAALAVSLMFTGCTQMPTEKQSISDMRPQISFKADGPRAQGARVFVDNLDMGMVADFIEGKAALRILPGTHIVSVTSGGSILLEEKVYLGDGVSRSFTVK
ncbi:MAG: hypothetical protein V4443_03925 [Pseudomonadota bacterium]